jgi:hypothetical protein
MDTVIDGIGPAERQGARFRLFHGPLADAFAGS